MHSDRGYIIIIIIKIINIKQKRRNLYTMYKKNNSRKSPLPIKKTKQINQFIVYNYGLFKITDFYVEKDIR